MAESPRLRDQAAPRTNRGIDRLHVATAAIVVAFLLGAALTYFLVWPREQPSDTPRPQRAASTPSPAANSGETRLVFPGWEDLVIGKEPPADARQRCERPFEGRGGEEERYEDCNGCRAANLALPCVRVGLEDGIVWMVSAEIPEGQERIARVLDAIRTAWGQPTKQRRDLAMDSDCWYRQRDHASYNAFKYDLSAAKDLNSRVPRRQHPIRTIQIFARDTIDYCEPTLSGVRDDGANRKATDTEYALWERCMEKHCEGEMWAGGECQHSAEEGANLEEWCRDEWAATKRCSKKHCARFETE